MAHDITKTNSRSTPTARPAPTLTRPVAVPARDLPKIERAQPVNHNQANKAARRQAEAESRRRYHAAWQEYYQKYYQHYYLKQLEDQKRQFESDTKDQLPPEQRAADELRRQLLSRISENAVKIKKSKHFKPILAGLVAVLLIVFIQYNQLLSAGLHSLISPADGSSIIIAANANRPDSQNPTLLIPKLSVRAPIIFDAANQTEAGSQEALEQGVVSWPVDGASAKPGQYGNSVILGHSSSDIFNSGQYKFIFVQLNRLNLGDLFYIDYENVRYSYEIIDKKIIAPTDLQALNLGESAPFASLITCDPPGTTLNRLVVIGRQISPKPSSAAETQSTPDTKNQDIPGNPPTLFERLFN
ncbi:MAG: sortase [Candidatus Nomurabacteria bacterium]|jgi:sortase A|nr:sortase [Candidatus Nomurabacteria bacterium]